MNQINPWPAFGISATELEEMAVWLSRDHPRFSGASVMFFRTAGSLLRFSQYDFTLLSLAFFQAVIGLEKMLRIHYQSENLGFKGLLGKAVADGTVRDSSFSKIEPLKSVFAARIEVRTTTYAEKFASLIPALRNEFFHGHYTLDPQFLRFTLQVREAVDALLESPPPE